MSTSTDNNRLLSIDTCNMYAEHIGIGGVTAEHYQTLAGELATIHNDITKELDHGLDSEYACLSLHDTMQDQLDEISRVAEAIRHFQNILVIGIGGSSLGCKAIRHALKPERLPENPVSLRFVENIDPFLLEGLFQELNPKNTALICISKSGDTIETVAQYQILRQWLIKHLGKKQASKQQWLVTDPEQGWLHECARRDNITALAVPRKVGGRYSVLSAVGLLPLRVSGVDIQELLQGAADNAARCQSPVSEENPALEMAALYYLLDVECDKHLSIMMPYVNRLRLFVDWYCQLWAESLGKNTSYKNGVTAAGTLPVRAMGAVDQHSQLQMYLESRKNKMFSFIELTQWQNDIPLPQSDFDHSFFPYLKDKSLVDVIAAEFCATRQVITDTGHPNLTVSLPELSAYTLGQLIDLYQRTTIYTGLLYGINPQDQPSVEKGKKLAIECLNNKYDSSGTKT
jgi:glucose-6-phosphate isomerase